MSNQQTTAESPAPAPARSVDTDPDAFVLVRNSTTDDGSPTAMTDVAVSFVDDRIVAWFNHHGGPGAVWSEQIVHRIQSRRSQLPDARLFFDELLSLAQVDTSLYPPSSVHGLSTLIAAINRSRTFDSLKRNSLLFYLMQDLDSAITPNQHSKHADPAQAVSLAHAFADSFWILPHFRDSMTGYWLLDQGRYEHAVPMLSSPNFIPKIMRTLFVGEEQAERTPLDRSRLLLQFLRTSTQQTSSAPDSPEYLDELGMQVQATCWVKGPTRALQLTRELVSGLVDDEQGITLRHQEMRAYLMNRIFLHCFAPPNPTAIKNLLGCFLDPEEETALETFVIFPPPALKSNWAFKAADILIVRFINQGRYMDAVRLDRRLGPDVSSGHGSESIDPAERSQLIERRKKLLIGARQILPEVQKELLRIEESMEISAGASKKDADSGKDAKHQERSEASDAADLKMSWEQVPRPGSQDRQAHASPPAATKGSWTSTLTPLSASPALREKSANSPSTQAALLSAVVRASASPIGSPSTPSAKGRFVAAPGLSASPASFSPSPAAATAAANGMVGFLAKNSLAFGQSPTSSSGTEERAAEHESGDATQSAAAEPGQSSWALQSKPGYRLSSVQAAASPLSGEASTLASPNASAASPWRNSQTLTSTSPFSGQPKIPAKTFAGRLDTLQSASSSASTSPFRPVNTSPFVAAGSSSSRQSPYASASPLANTSQRLPGALGVISRQTRRRFDSEQPVDMDQDDEGDEQEQAADGDETFVGRVGARTGGKDTGSRGKFKIGRLVPGRDNRIETDEEDDGAAEEPSSKVTRSKSGNVKSKNGSANGGMSRTRSEASIKRTTRSTSAANRKPLTSSNLAANDSALLDARPIARRTRAATAELESLQGGESHDGMESIPEDASTAYSVSEAGEEQDAVGELPSRRGARGGKKASRAGAGAGAGAGTTTQRRVRRSTRLSSVEPIEESQDQEKERPRRRSRTLKRASSQAAASETDELAPGVRTRSGRRTMPGALDEE